MQITNDDTTLMAESSDSELEDEAIIETSIGPQLVSIQEPDDVPQETYDREMIEMIEEVESEEENDVPMDGMPSMKQKKMRHKEKFASWLVWRACVLITINWFVIPG